MELLVACKEAPIVESVQFAQDNNLGIEIKSFTSPLIFQSDWQGLCDVIKKQLLSFKGARTLHGVIYSGHFVWDRMNVKKFKENQEKILSICYELEVKTLVVHSTFIPGLTSWKYKDWLDSQVDIWGHIAKIASENDIEIVIKNIVDEAPKNILEIIEMINSPNLKACIDFGHLNLIPTTIPMLNWIDELKNSLTYIHVHNNNERYDSHSSLDNGTIDYNLIFNKFFDLQISPKVAIEANSLTCAKASLDIINNMINAKSFSSS
ncbi:MAG: sugar phosphate isomerase/epimerase [Cyanobacteriota bacterium]